MSSEGWQQVNALYSAALEREPDERAAFLTAACAGEAELLREVESLLAARERQGILDAPALEAAAQVLAAEQTQFWLGKQLGHYQINSLLGAGGMGEVYLAQDLRLGRNLALKLLPHSYTHDQERVQRFKQEARAASALNHPNIITIFEIDEIDGAHFIATEFIDGATLRQVLEERQLEMGELLSIAAQVAAALAEAHAAGIVHRDIKPENVMVRHDGIVKVLDFGLAKLTEQNAPPAALHTPPFITDPGQVLGTPRYMSPEQLTGLQVDGRADIFSLGVVLYEMIAGRSPFARASSAEVIAAILNEQPPPLACAARAVPNELERMVSKALAKDRAQRHQATGDLLLDLKRLSLALEAKLVAPNPTPSAVSLSAIDAPENLEPPSGAVPLDSKFYLLRPADAGFRAAIARRDSSVLVKGARQVGKTSLLARGLQQARAAGAQVVLTDLQKLSAAQMATAEAFYLALSERLADQLELKVLPEADWPSRRGASINFERYLRRQVLGETTAHVVWGLDEVDRLFTCNFGSEVFGLFRSWHNERALDPQAPWQRLTLALAYATEAHLFITDMNQSPFNVGTRLALGDFSYEQVAELNERYGAPLKGQPEVARYYRLVGGHPFLVRCGLHEMVTQKIDLAELEAMIRRDEGPYEDHLRRILLSLTQDDALAEVVKGILQGKPCADAESFYRLRSAGLMTGESPRAVRPRCQLYANYLEQHLL